MAFSRALHYVGSMKASSIAPNEKTNETAATREPGYEAWKRARIEAALRQAADRSQMIPENEIWRELGLER